MNFGFVLNYYFVPVHAKTIFRIFIIGNNDTMTIIYAQNFSSQKHVKLTQKKKERKYPHSLNEHRPRIDFFFFSFCFKLQISINKTRHCCKFFIKWKNHDEKIKAYLCNAIAWLLSSLSLFLYLLLLQPIPVFWF